MQNTPKTILKLFNYCNMMTAECNNALPQEWEFYCYYCMCVCLCGMCVCACVSPNLSSPYLNHSFICLFFFSRLKFLPIVIHLKVFCNHRLLLFFQITVEAGASVTTVYSVKSFFSIRLVPFQGWPWQITVFHFIT